MKMKDVQKKAKEMGIKPAKMRKTELIHTIQAQEGNTQCYQSDVYECAQMECCWRQDCM